MKRKITPRLASATAAMSAVVLATALSPALAQPKTAPATGAAKTPAPAAAKATTKPGTKPVAAKTATKTATAKTATAKTAEKPFTKVSASASPAASAASTNAASTSAGSSANSAAANNTMANNASATPKASASAASIEDMVKQANTEVFRSIIERNASIYDERVADDAVLMGFGPGIVSKFKAFPNNPHALKVETHRVNNMRVILEGDTAVVAGRLWVKYAPGSDVAQSNTNFLNVFAKRNNRWQLIAGHLENQHRKTEGSY